MIHEVNRKLKVSTMDGQYSNDHINRSNLSVLWDSNNNKTAIAIGINPSKANDSRSDKTLTTFARFLDAYGFCKFTMLNLFENYSTPQSGINRSTTTDFSKYESFFESVDSIFIIWGVANDYQEEKVAALKVLEKYYSKLLCIQNESGNKPIHPSRMTYSDKIISYDINIQ